MEPRRYAETIWKLAKRGELPSTLARGVKRALIEADQGDFTLEHQDADAPFLSCPPEAVERWNKEWLRYLEREHAVQLSPHTAYPDTPPLPGDPEAMLAVELAKGQPLTLYCDREHLLGKRVLEVGCGCGHLGKQLARYVESYLGTDYSTLALEIARLVSPPNATYLHLADRDALAARFGSIDTTVARHFFIHQNQALARRVLGFMAAFLTRGGRVYADFYWPNPELPQGKVFTPRDPLSKQYPSATFAYAREDVIALPFRIERESIHRAMQRRYVVLEKT